MHVTLSLRHTSGDEFRALLDCATDAWRFAASTISEALHRRQTISVGTDERGRG